MPTSARSTSPTISSPLPKGGWHGEAVTGGFLTSPHLLQPFRRGDPCGRPREGKSAKRRQWRMKQAGFEEVPRLAGTTVPVSRSAQRWAREPLPYGSVTRTVAKRGVVDAAPYKALSVNGA